jgi:hydrogenase maturation protease
VLIASAGNRLLGDDGVGQVVLDRLRARSPWGGRVGFHALEGDLFELAEWADKAEHLIVLDAIAGNPVGEIDRITGAAHECHTPSFHQADVATVLRQLELVNSSGVFPRWEVWGIRIEMPTEFRDRLSGPVELAATHLEGLVVARVEKLLDAAPPTNG